MTLPFDNNTDKKTKEHQCFVCGVLFSDLKSYFSHIEDTHEEGRDYIKCPLNYCKACVRDIRLHFQRFHKSQPIPKKGQLKAMIWKDFSPKGKKKTRKPNFKDGWHESLKMNKDRKSVV
jgi:hypothetical protein